MGLLQLESAIEPVEGNFVGKIEMETVACKHCGGVIAILVKGCSRNWNAKRRCERCDGPICKHCAIISKQQGGSCSPIMAKIEFALKHGWWNSRLKYEYKILPN